MKFFTMLSSLILASTMASAIGTIAMVRVKVASGMIMLLRFGVFWQPAPAWGRCRADASGGEHRPD